MFINHHQPASPKTVLMPAWVEFCPPFFAPYIGLLLITWLLPVAIRDHGLFRACVMANVCAWLLVMPWWILTPTTLARPPLPDEPWAESFRLLWARDQPYNVFPCAHGIGPVVAAWFAGRDHPAWRWPLAALLLVGLPSIALTWQHRPVDILVGTLAAVIGILVGETVSRRASHANTRRHQPRNSLSNFQTSAHLFWRYTLEFLIPHRRGDPVTAHV